MFSFSCRECTNPQKGSLQSLKEEEPLFEGHFFMKKFRLIIRRMKITNSHAPHIELHWLFTPYFELFRLRRDFVIRKSVGKLSVNTCAS